MTKVLCIDADEYLTDLLRFALEREGFDVLIGRTGRDAQRFIRAKRPDLVLLDLHLPDFDGFKVLTWLRTFSQVPVVMLSARAHDEDIVASLDQGADECVVKPFSIQVLVSRVKALLRRAEPVGRLPKPSPKPLPTSGATYRIDGYLFDPSKHEIVGHGARVMLTLTESYILHLLFLHEGHPLPAKYVLGHLFDDDAERDARVIKTHIRRLRRKIVSLPNNPQPIRTLAHLGYVVQQTDANGNVLVRAG